MSTQKERLRQGIETAGQGHAVKLLEGEQADKPKQTPGLPLSPVRRLPPSEIRLSEKNQKAFAPLSGPEFERLKADIAERRLERMTAKAIDNAVRESLYKISTAPHGRTGETTARGSG